MYSLLKMGIFHCHVSLLEGIASVSHLQHIYPSSFKNPAMPAEPSKCAMFVFAAPSTTLDPVLGSEEKGSIW